MIEPQYEGDPSDRVFPQVRSRRPFTSRVKSSLELAMACARECSNSSVGTQHLLVGLIRDGKGIAAQVLVHSGMTIDQVVGALGRAADDDDVTRKGH